MNSILLILPNLIHENVWISRDRLNSNLALTDITQLNLGLVAPLNFDTWSIYMCDVASENLWLGVDSLKIKSHQGTGKKVTILDHNTVVSLGDNVHSSLLEVGETTVGDLDITVYGDGARSLISLVTNEITTDQVDAATWKTDKSSEFLIEAIGD